MTFKLMDLPFDHSDLEPYMSEQTLQFHHGKHHNTYVTKLNEFIAGTKYEGMSLEEVILSSYKNKDNAIFNNSAQVYNHDFFWKSMKKNGGGKPSGKIAEMIDSSFGSYDNFVSEFKQAAVGQFGSGWVWLTNNGNKLEIMKTPNAELPLIHDKKAVITCDVWEHAYYLDYQNRRPDFVSVFLDHLINWEFASENI